MQKSVSIDSRILSRKPEELLKEPVVIRVNEFTEESVKEFAKQFHQAHMAEQDVIPIVIDSYGGIIDSLLAMVDYINSSEIPVATIVQGKAMSCGAVLLSCGDDDMRWISPNSRVMIHEAGGLSFGKTGEVEVGASELRRLNRMILRIMSKNCGHNADYFKDLIHEKGHANWYLTAKQTKAHNLANHVGVPTLNLNVEVSMELS